MDSAKDYYAVLEITPMESLDGIHTAFRRLAKQCHPDRAGAQAAERFRAVLEAYQVLSDPPQRELYNESLHGSRPRMAPQPLRARRDRNYPEPLTTHTPMTSTRRGGLGRFRQEVREFGRIAEVMLSPILSAPELTTDEADFIRLYLSQLIDRFGL